MIRTTWTLLAAATLGIAGGLPPRSAPVDYSAHSSQDGVTVAAEVMSRDQVRNAFSTDLSNYIVMEVAVYPAADKEIDVSAIDFALVQSGSRSLTRPAAPRTIASLNQKRSNSRKDDILLYPNVGVSTGSWGTGTQVGLGVGLGGGAPAPASTDKDRQVMEQELDDRGLQDAVVRKPIAGYVFFPMSAAKRRQASDVELQFESGATRIRVPVTIREK